MGVGRQGLGCQRPWSTAWSSTPGCTTTASPEPARPPASRRGGRSSRVCLSRPASSLFTLPDSRLPSLVSLVTPVDSYCVDLTHPGEAGKPHHTLRKPWNPCHSAPMPTSLLLSHAAETTGAAHRGLMVATESRVGVTTRVTANVAPLVEASPTAFGE